MPVAKFGRIQLASAGVMLAGRLLRLFRVATVLLHLLLLRRCQLQRLLLWLLQLLHLRQLHQNPLPSPQQLPK